MSRPTTTWIPRAAQRVERWRNGGGTTRTVAIDPPGADLASGFRWRISIADVGQDGPFSHLPGVDRALWLLAGNGVELTCGTAATVLRVHERLDFAGEAPISARLLAGPVQDLNVMTARAHVAAVAWLGSLAPGEGRTDGLGDAPHRVVVVLDGSLRAVCGGAAESLSAGDAVRTDGGAAVELAASAPCAFLTVGFWPSAR